MEAKALASDRLDHLDAERFKDMLKSPPFQLLRLRIEGELERARSVCERSDELRETSRAQGAVAAIRSVLNLPAILLGEMQAVLDKRGISPK